MPRPPQADTGGPQTLLGVVEPGALTNVEIAAREDDAEMVQVDAVSSVRPVP